MRALVFATHNQGKLAELRRLLAAATGAALRVQSLAELGVPDDVDEDGETLLDNARKKARSAHARTGLLCLSDDSGLEVDALGGAPGVHSARYGGAPRSDARNIEALLAALRDVPEDRRSARFRCCLYLCGAEGDQHFTGTLEGTLLRAPRGDGGFGYDPLFVPAPAELAAAGLPEALAGRTLAELSLAEKNRLSHRGRAMAQLLPVLVQLLQGRAERA